MLFLRPMRYSASATATATAGSSRDPLHVCVVGSGPAGFYTAEKVRPFGSLVFASLWGLVSLLIPCPFLHCDSVSVLYSVL